MKKSLTVYLLFFLALAVAPAHAESEKKKCPKLIADLSTGEFKPSAGNYECFSKESAAMKAGFASEFVTAPPQANRCDQCNLRGCCSHHGGVSSCPGGKVVCSDGTKSPSCRC